LAEKSQNTDISRHGNRWDQFVW